MRPLKYIYLPEMGVTGYESGALLMMDVHPDQPFEKDHKGMWFFADARREPDGSHDLGWSTKVINSLLRKGWVVEEGTYDDRGKPLRVWRSGQPGFPADAES